MFVITDRYWARYDEMKRVFERNKDQDKDDKDNWMIAFEKGVAWHRKSMTRMKKTLTEDFDAHQGEIASTYLEYDNDYEQEENEDTCEDFEDDGQRKGF